jgi:hypothetical protein
MWHFGLGQTADEDSVAVAVVVLVLGRNKGLSKILMDELLFFLNVQLILLLESKRLPGTARPSIGNIKQPRRRPKFFDSSLPSIAERAL